MKKQKGITLISLAVTVIVLTILASIATYSGINVIKSSKFTAFSTELKIMQTQVNAIYDQKEGSNSYGEEITGTIKTQADKVFTSNESGITSQEGYRFWSNATIKSLGIEGVEQDFFVNVSKRSVISYQGLEYDGKKYYTLEQLPDGLYNVEYKESNAEKPTFNANVEKIGNGRWRITISDIQYNGYIDKWQVYYELEGKTYGNTTEDLSFVVNTAGAYKIKIQNDSVVSEEQLVTIETRSQLEQAKEAGTVLDENNPVTIKDKYDNEIKVPEGFKIASDSADDVTGGVVIEDVSAGTTTTKGSQFVWIPVGEVKYEGGSKTIELNRYTFAEDGTPTKQENNVIDTYYQELATSTYGNRTANDIEGFKTTVTTNHGYYIGRYEAGSTTLRTSSSNKTTPMVCKEGQHIYYYVTQQQAAALSKGMYTDKKFTSDLINSYAWDTAIVFIQEFSLDKDYSKQFGLQEGYALTGQATDGTNKDVRCNIYDMAGNGREFTTETSSQKGVDASFPCVYRGGNALGLTTNTADSRYRARTTWSNTETFRNILYL